MWVALERHSRTRSRWWWLKSDDDNDDDGRLASSDFLTFEEVKGCWYERQLYIGRINSKAVRVVLEFIVDFGERCRRCLGPGMFTKRVGSISATSTSALQTPDPRHQKSRRIRVAIFIRARCVLPRSAELNQNKILQFNHENESCSTSGSQNTTKRRSKVNSNWRKFELVYVIKGLLQKH